MSGADNWRESIKEQKGTSQEYYCPEQDGMPKEGS